MKTELDRIPSTITLSLGLKNRIRKLKGSMTYEQYLTQLIKERNEFAHSTNHIELQEFKRKNLVFFYAGFKVLLDYNGFNNSPNHIFDIRIKRILYFSNKSNVIKLAIAFGLKKQQYISKSYSLYFELLMNVIRQELKLSFKHKGRFEDFDSWSQEFKNLGLSKKSLEYDVKDKLVDYQSGVAFK